MDDNTYRDEIEYWAQIWDQCQEDDEFQAMNVPNVRYEDNVDVDPATQYVYDRISDNPEVLLQEVKTPNPVYPDSVGMDSQNPKPAWVKEDLIKELEGMKTKLFELENKMAALGSKEMVQEPVLMKSEEVPAKIESLKKEINKISDQLGIKDEPSPWNIDAKEQK